MAFLTANEMAAAFVALLDYMPRVYVASAGALASVDHAVLVICDTSGGGFQLDLPVAPDAKFSPVIMNTGPNPVTIGGTVNGVVDPDISIQWSALDLKHNSGTYYTGVPTIP